MFGTSRFIKFFVRRRKCLGPDGVVSLKTEDLMIKPSLVDAVKVAGTDDYEYLRNFVHPLPGWLIDYAALRILDLLKWQLYT